MKYSKTEAGQLAFKARSAALTPGQRSAFIMFDGKKTVEEVLAMTAGLGVVMADVQQMLAAGFLAEVAGTVDKAVQAPAVLQPDAGGLSPAQRYALAWPIATRITASLGLRGFRLNLAVEAASGYEQLRDLLPKIREAVGPEKARPLEDALKA